MKIEIKSVIFVLLTSVSVRAITHYVRSESSRTVEKQKTEVQWEEDTRENRYEFKGQREIATVPPSTTSAVELVDAKETVPDKTPSPIVIAYFVANVGEKTKEVYNSLPIPDSRNIDNGYVKGYGRYGLKETLGFGGHLALKKPYTGYRQAPVSGYGYGYGYGGYGYLAQDGNGYPVLGKTGGLGRKLRRMKDHLHFWRGFVKRLL